MKPEDVVNELKNFARSLLQLKKPIQLVAMKTLEGRMKRRIFNEGRATDNSKIGNYSTKKLYASKDSFAKTSAFVSNTKGGKTMRVDGGYKELRDIQGFQTNYVDTDYTGSLRMSIGVGDTGENIVLGFFDSENYEKSFGLEEHFDKVIYAPNEDEEDAAFKAAESVIDNLARKIGLI